MRRFSDQTILPDSHDVVTTHKRSSTTRVAGYYEPCIYGYLSLTEKGVEEAERRGLMVDIDAYGCAGAIDPITREVVDLDAGRKPPKMPSLPSRKTRIRRKARLNGGQMRRFSDQTILPGAYEEVITYERLGPGKLSDTVAEFVYDVVLDGGETEFLGNAQDFGVHSLVEFPEGVLVRGSLGDPDDEWAFYAAILSEGSQGFVDVVTFDTIEEARDAWAGLEAEFDAFIEEAVGYFMEEDPSLSREEAVDLYFSA